MLLFADLAIVSYAGLYILYIHKLLCMEAEVLMCYWHINTSLIERLVNYMCNIHCHMYSTCTLDFFISLFLTLSTFSPLTHYPFSLYIMSSFITFLSLSSLSLPLFLFLSLSLPSLSPSLPFLLPLSLSFSLISWEWVGQKGRGDC